MMFNKQIIDATKDLCVAYKPNIAFYESMGVSGWHSLQKTLDYISKDIFTIADTKRGDIGNTSKKYAETFFSTYNFDSITVAPYMGEDSITPFLEYPNKWTIILGLTSNDGSKSFQNLSLEKGNFLFQEVLESSSKWGTKSNMMYVVGATKPKYIEKIRSVIPEHFLLMPGIGAQGGDLNKICKYALNDNIGIIVNSSRSISAQPSDDFSFVFSVLTAVIVGGTSIMGGKGAIWRTVAAAFFLAFMNNGFNLLQVDPLWQRIILGLVIVIAVALDSWSQRKNV